MIIDTSALVALLRREPGHPDLANAIAVDGGMIPAPVLVEFRRVTKLSGNRPDPIGTDLIERLNAAGVTFEPFTAADAKIAADANETCGTGNGRGGKLNMLDLMVYAVAKRTRRPILCTGRDFASTDAKLHPASRVG